MVADAVGNYSGERVDSQAERQKFRFLFFGGCAIIGKAHHLNQEGKFNVTAQGRREGKNGEDEKAGKIENEQVSPLVFDVAHISDYQVLGFTLFVRFQTELYPHSRVECLGFAAGSVQPNLHVLNSTIEIGG